MYIIVIAWGFVVVLMSAAEAMTTSVIGGLLTFIFYGAVPIAIFVYVFGSAQRKRYRLQRERDAAARKDDSS